MPEESRSCGKISGRMPYFAGLNRAACTPSRPRTVKAEVRRPGGWRVPQVPASIEQEFQNLHGEDNGPLADPVCEEPGGERDEHQRHHQDDLREGRVPLRGGLVRPRPDRQKHDDGLPGVIIERTGSTG